MKKQVRILLFAVLTVLLFMLAIVGVTAAGEFVVKSSNNAQQGAYDTLAAAVGAVPDNGIIEVQTDVSISDAVTLNASKTYKIKGLTGSEVITFTTWKKGLTIAAGTVTLENIGITANAHVVTVKGSTANLTCLSGTTLKSTGNRYTWGGALVFSGGATVTIEGGTYQGVIWSGNGTSIGHGTAAKHTIVTINGGTFTQNPTMRADTATDGLTSCLLQINGNYTDLTVNGGSFTFVTTANMSATSAGIYLGNATASVTVNGGSFVGRGSGQYGLIDKREGTLVIDSTPDNNVRPAFTVEDSIIALWVRHSAALTVNDGEFTQAASGSGLLIAVDTTHTEAVAITGGSYQANGEGTMLLLLSGNLHISGGAFTSVGTDIIVVSARTGSLTVTGGAFTLAASSVQGGVILRTVAWVTDQADQYQYYDPTTVYAVPEIPITISGGRFTDLRESNSKLIDTSVGDCMLTVTEIFMLSNAKQPYFIDAGDGLGTDVTMDESNRAYMQQVNNGGLQYYAYIYSAASENAPVMKEGAAVDLNLGYSDGSYNGIRFHSYIPASVVVNLGLTINDEYGTLIAPADYVAAAGGFTHALMNALYNNPSYNFQENGLSAYVDIPAHDSKFQDSEGNFHFSGALVQIQAENYDRPFAAVSYIRLEDGTYYYSTFDVDRNVRSMREVSKAALMDYSEVQGGKSEYHIYDSIYKPFAYSRYTPLEQERLQQYSGYTHSLTAATVTLGNDSPVYTNAAENSAVAKAIAAMQSTLNGFAAVGNAATPVIVGAAQGHSAVTADALAEIDGEGYYVGVKLLFGGEVVDYLQYAALTDAEKASCGRYIVIIGTSDAYTLQALQVFERAYLRAGEASVAEIVHEGTEAVVLNTDVPILFAHTRDGNYENPYTNPTITSSFGGGTGISFTPGYKTHIYNKEQNGYTYNLGDGPLVDYPVVAGFEIGAALTARGGTPSFTDGARYSFLPDNLSVGGFRIEIGLTEYARTEILNGYDYGTYGYSIRDGRIVITAFDDATLRLAKQRFIDDLEAFLVDGMYQIPADLSYDCLMTDGLARAVEAMEAYEDAQGADSTASTQLAQFGFITAVPRPALILSGAVDVGDNTLQLYYNEDDVTVEKYSAYCDLLVSQGFAVYMQEHVVEGSRFVTYYRESDHILLHVMYDAFAHAAEESVGASSTLADMFRPTLRIMATDYDNTVATLMPSTYFALQQSSDWQYDTMITNVQMEAHCVGYCYIYTLEDGSFVVLDGGGDTSANNATTAKVIYNTLVSLYEKLHGEAPSAAKPIKIAAWYLSHGHGDHYSAMEKFISTYVNVYSSKVFVEAIIHSFPSNDEIYNSFDPNIPLRNKYLQGNGYKNGSGASATAIPYYRVHTGQVFFVRNLRFEVLYTHEDIHPWAMEFFNNTTTVIRLTALDTDGTGAPVTGSRTVSNLVLGDLQVRGGMVMRARYGDYLKSDMVAVAHHGGNGVEAALYGHIDAQVVWWTNTAYAMMLNVDPDSTTPSIMENVKWLSSTRWVYIIVQIPRLPENYQCLTVTLTEDGFPGLYSRMLEDTDETLAAKQSAGQAALLANIFSINCTSSGNLNGVTEEGEHGFTFGEGKFNTDADYKGKFLIGRQNYFYELYELPITEILPEGIDDARFDPFPEEITPPALVWN